MKIGFIGTGVMGTGMINNLLKNNYEVNVFNRTKAHADTVIKNGANWNDSPKSVAGNSDVVITIVGFPNDVEQVYFGDDGLLAGASKGEILIDSTTSKPKIDEKIYNESKKLGVEALDAPVSGGDVGAQNGNLTFMVGGDQAIFNKVKPVLNSMGSNVQIFGSAGKGQHTKMANQIMIAGNMTGLTEMLDYGKHADLDLSSLIKIVSQGGGDNWSLENYGPRVLKDDFKPGFAAKHFLKDLRIALECANEMHIDLPATKLAKQLYEKMVDQMDLGSDGTQGLIKLYK
ncbi:NAD(P)-dependent oxidoreductase [Apilactobacillus micheneri]|uniref:NAD(P)-dependent oxidoreductase n=1 Tax=Apilactobacillus micheneri TaxID=1899430 RepID=A0A2S2JL92_9LACO|nr:NAD(P)-dependent oxidoreductase [Apilactobacillus micheneri]TPR40967.1 NAD(P)-dependent oxidoreductase [Apilactobacillus micheneri]TPR42547.1 NAD(P)-dependent oxidoreductase [Apilactobacillus micheneri]TPR45516.1 NAD(P)-dependent oxidoreductase [Apilactobacillus micheneri]TPR46074.1 NAD(P)-dependent oxidoreductase [Apilactobacillus micheneri]TPR46759.1 NAD(P)-dependent oxidoreductase [Apilactobacillus micheneri]